jgi:hypothetical protein
MHEDEKELEAKLGIVYDIILRVIRGAWRISWRFAIVQSSSNS